MHFFRRKKSIQAFSGEFANSAPYLNARPAEQGILALPTNLEEVVKAAHSGTPRHLPGDDASQDEVRYFLYQILTLKEYKIVLAHPQWVLETCMYWRGNGSKLRSLPIDAFQQLCPLSPGYATIDWRAKGSKFKREQIPPCSVRHAIGHLINHIVASLKSKEHGNKGPGWQVSGDSQGPAETMPEGMGQMQGSDPSFEHRLSTPSFPDHPGYPVQHSFYNFSNQSLPLIHKSPTLSAQQASMYMLHQMPTASSQYGMSAAGSERQSINSESSAQVARNDKACASDSRPVSPLGSPPISPPGSPISSYCHTESISSRLTESTAKTSPPSSESETPFWAIETNRPRSVAPSRLSGTDIGYASPGMYQVSDQRTSTATPSRYRASPPSPAAQAYGRSFDPVRRLAYLRSGSYSSMPTGYAPSETSLTPSDSATNKYSLRRDSVMPPFTAHSSSRRHSSFYMGSNTPSSPSIQSYDTATPHARSAIEPMVERSATPRMGSAAPLMRSYTTLARPMNNYKVDAHAFDSAEHVTLKSRPSQVRSLIIEAERNRVLGRQRSVDGLCQRKNKFTNNIRGDEDFVGPSMRFENPRTGQPRLTIYETIAEREKLGKPQVENQGRLEMQQRRGLTVYETIEEKEILDGKPQRGMDASMGNNWTS